VKFITYSMATAPMPLFIVGALCAIAVAATNTNRTYANLRAKALRSGASQPILDEAAFNEAEINDKESSRETEMGYIETGVDDQGDADVPDSKSFVDAGVDDDDLAPGSEDDVEQLNAALDESTEDGTEDEVREKVPEHRHLRAKPHLVSLVTGAPKPPPTLAAKVTGAPMPPPTLAANILDPAQWTSNSSSATASMEKQLTDLMMSGKGGLAGTPLGKSVRQISKIIKDEMIVKVNDAHKSNQAQLIKEAKSIEECGSTKESQVATANIKKGVYLRTSPLHKTCRAGEEGKLNEKTEAHNEMQDKKRIKDLKCKEFAMVGRKYGDQQANGQIVKRGGSEHTQTYIERLTSTVCGMPFKHGPGLGGAGVHGFSDNYLKAKYACEAATRDWNHATKKYTVAAKEFADKKSECDSLQDQMDNSACKRATQMKDACETYAECYFDRKKAHDATVHMVKNEEKDRKVEWRGLKRMQCLMKAFTDGQVSSSEITTCKAKTHTTHHLIINYPKVLPIVVCSVPKLYPSTPEYKLAEFAPLPALAKGKQDANECTGIIEISTQPAQGSPPNCKCERMTLNGPYSAGPLVKCSDCLEARRSLDRNSCPDGTKIFSPRGALDWKTILSSVGEIKAPHFIVDITRPRSGCGGCNNKPMNSDKVNQGREWKTSDGSPWWLRSAKYSEPKGNYQPNCYLGLLKSTDENTIKFDDNGCNYFAKSYYCQLKDLNMKPKEGSPAACKCKQEVLAGPYSAGALIKCTNCLDIYKSMQKNSCPLGTKIFSPANAQDWKTFLASAQPLRSPSWIIDVTRPQNGCGGCQHKPMNSKSPAQMTWRTSDGSPWWLRSSTYSEPNGDYTANCYMDLWKTPFSETNIMFNDAKCKAHSDAYYCQPVKKQPAPPPPAPPPSPPPAPLEEEKEDVPPAGAKDKQLPCKCVPCGSRKSRKYPGGSCGPQSNKCGPSAGRKKDGCYSSSRLRIATCDCKMLLTAKSKEDTEKETKKTEKKEKKEEDEGDDDDDDDDKE